MSDIDLDFAGDAEAAPPVQNCSICGNPLSRYNNTGVCFHHPDTRKLQRQAERESLRNREIEKASRIELIAMAIQTNRVRLIKDKLAKGEKERIRQDLLFDLVCQDFSVARDEIIQPGRKTAFVEARQVLMYLLYNDTSLSYLAIGKLLGGRDHTTIIHGANKIETELQTDRELSARVGRLRSHYQRPD